MEDWQEWQIRADQIAAELNADVDSLAADCLPADAHEFNARRFWPRFRSLKDRVRTAPAIRLEAKLELERRLRGIGAKAYKAQEVVSAGSRDRRDEIMREIAALRAGADNERDPRALRLMRRDFDRLREQFDNGPALTPPDRQSVWDAWREANQYAWQKLVDMWAANETELRSILADARQAAEKGNANVLRQSVGRFFESLRRHEAKQDAVVEMKAEADALRRQADEIEERSAAARTPAQRVARAPTADGFRAEIARHGEMIARLADEIASLEQQMQESGSILEQAMLRGTVVEKKRKRSELERASRTLEQKIEQMEEAPLIPIG